MQGIFQILVWFLTFPYTWVEFQRVLAAVQFVYGFSFWCSVVEILFSEHFLH